MALRHLSYFLGCLALIGSVYYGARGIDVIKRNMEALDHLSEYQMRLSISLANTSAELLANPGQALSTSETLSQLLGPSTPPPRTLQRDLNYLELLSQKAKLEESMEDELTNEDNIQLLQQFREGLEILTGHNQQLRSHRKQAVLRALTRLLIIDGSLLLFAMGCIGIPLAQQQRALLKAAQSSNRALEEKAQALHESHQTIGNMLQDMVYERRKASQTAEANARLAALINSADDAILSLNLAGFIVTANNAALETFGPYCQGKCFVKQFASNTEEHLSKILTKTELENSGTTTNVSLQHHTRQLTFALTLSPLRSDQDQLIGFSVIAKDITRSQKEQERFRLAVEAAPNAMIMINQLGNIVLFNTEAERMFGYSAEELNGKSIHQLVPKELKGAHEHHVEKFFEAPTRRSMGRGHGELRGRRKNGECFAIEVGLTPVETEDRSYVISSIVDISGRQKQQAKLNTLNEELTRKNQEMEQFIYTVSHDLKAPLVTIAGFAMRLRNNGEATLTDKQLHQIDRILANVKAMETLLQDLLHLSRIIKRDLEKTWVDPETALQSVLATLEGSIAERGAKINIRRPLTKIYAQESLLLQCLQNILSNALKYTKPGESPVIDIHSITHNDSSGLVICDQGVGIAPHHQERVFNVFERLNPQVCEGTGVGLSIVKAIMDKHSGQVSLKSNEGSGTQFTLLFPPPTQGEADES